jgi:hypothetical protein
MNSGGWPTRCQPEIPIFSRSERVEQEGCSQSGKLAQLLPNSCGQSKKADSKDKKSANTER